MLHYKAGSQRAAPIDSNSMGASPNPFGAGGHLLKQPLKILFLSSFECGRTICLFVLII